MKSLVAICAFVAAVALAIGIAVGEVLAPVPPAQHPIRNVATPKQVATLAAQGKKFESWNLAFLEAEAGRMGISAAEVSAYLQYQTHTTKHHAKHHTRHHYSANVGSLQG